MTTLRAIRNPHALQRLARFTCRRFQATRSVPLDTVSRSRAQSLLAGLYYRDDSTNPGPLTLDQARDVLAWAIPRNF